MNENRNTLLAIALSAIILIGWQYFVGVPQLNQQQQTAQQKQSQTGAPQPAAQAPAGAPAPAAAVKPPETRESALAAAPRIAIETDRLKGSISLRGGRIDDLSLLKFRETVDPKSKPIVLLAPSGSPSPFYAELGFVGAPGATVKLPDANTLWTAASQAQLTPKTPVTLTFDNGEGLQFKRVISIDDAYLVTVQDSVENKSSQPVSLFPYGLVSRHGAPKTEGMYILHEGLLGVFGDQGLKESTYKDLDSKKTLTFQGVNSWLGITDKYWAAALLPDTKANVQGRFSAGTIGTLPTYQADYLLDQVTVAPGASTTVNSRLFAGAKEVNRLDAYEKALGLNRLELMIDWGWFYFITKPLFFVIEWLNKLVGNFGIAILLVTVALKGLFFPLANKSYASMAKMKAIQPAMTQIRERFADDKMAQQQAMMELYKKEKINPLAGCWPVLLQIPVFFALYKVLFVTIEMRHAPFFGWIKDLSAPDPTTVFNLFGLLPFDPSTVPVLGSFMMLGVWPLAMGITMWVQMQMNPAPPDPTQKIMFAWMPVVFTFMLASFASGLVIYWTWNNLLSIAQQWVIMKKNGVKVELLDNLKGMFGGSTKTG